MSAAKLLDRLDRVKETGLRRWIARCPAHEDKSPSLSIRELDDGRVLLNCFAGCSVTDVLKSMALTWAELFPAGTRLVPSSSSRIPARDLLALVDHEVTVAALILADVLTHHTVEESQWTRLAEAAGRIGRAHEHGRA